MNLIAFDLNLLSAFAAIYETRSVSLAAERLQLRQPAVSGALARLRASFGDELFVRAGGAMQPTAKALRIAPGIQRALANFSETLADATPFTPSIVERTFTIASTDYTTSVIVPALISAVKGHAPNIDVRIVGYDKSDVAQLIDRGEIDLALGVFRDPPPRAVRKPLCSERFVGLCRRGHPLVENGGIALEAFAAAPHALVTVKRDARGEVDEALQRLGRSRRVALTLPHMLALPAILEVSDLLAAVPERVAARFSNDGLQQFELPLALPAWQIEMLWNMGDRSDKGHAWLRSIIAAAAARL